MKAERKRKNPVFPVLDIHFKAVSSAKNLSDLLRSRCHHKKYNNKTFSVGQSPKGQLTATCNTDCCDFHLKYQRFQGSFQQKFTLVEHNNVHNHQLKPHTEVLISQFYRLANKSLQMSQVKRQMKEKFELSQTQFHWLRKKIYLPDQQVPKNKCKLSNQKNFKEYLQSFYKNDEGFYRTVPKTLEDNQIPQIFVGITPQMMSDYTHYGQSFYIAVFEDLIEGRDQKQGQEGTSAVKQMTLGIFVGKNNLNNFVLFGVASFPSGFPAKNLKRMILMFFDLVKSRPQSIIVPKDCELARVVQELKLENAWEGQMVYEIESVLDQIKKEANPTLFKHLSQIKCTTSQEDFEKLLSECFRVSKTEQQKQLIQKCIQDSKYFLISRLRPCFVGIDQNYGNFVFRMRNFLRERLPFRKNCYQVLNQVYSIAHRVKKESELYSFSQIEYEKQHEDQKLYDVRKGLCEDVFEHFMHNYVLGLDLVVKRNIGKLNYTVRREGQYVKYQVNRGSDSESLNCSCKQQTKTGVPCSHIIGVLIQQNTQLSYLNFVEQRWHIQKQSFKKTWEVEQIVLGKADRAKEKKQSGKE